jgi:hypothetical protein
VGRLLEEAQLKPHQSRYWLTPPPDDEFDAKVENINDLYINAIERYQNGERTITIDEMTGIQAIERREKDLPMRPGKVERIEFEYIRHGTQSLIASFDVATGQIVEASCGDSRTEEDFVPVRRVKWLGQSPDGSLTAEVTLMVNDSQQSTASLSGQQ